MTLKSDTLISVCTVLRNDHAIAADFVRKTTAILSAHYPFHELLLIDNNSLDNTGAIIKELQKEVANVRLIRLSRMYSFETAMTAALDNSVGDVVVVMDAHYDPPELIPRLIDTASQGNDIVIVRRRNKRSYSLIDRWLSAQFYHLASRILGFELSIEDTEYRAFSRRAVNSLTQIRRKRRSLRYFNAQVGFKHGYVNLEEHIPDAHSLPRKRFYRFEAASVGGDLIISNSAAPLRFAARLGLLASFLNMLYFGYIIVVTLVKDEIVEGWITTSVMSTTMFFMLFLILAILTEYITRLLEESRDEPLYFVEYETSSTVSSYSEVMSEDRLNVV